MTTLLNARILASLGMIVFVAAIAASSTGAFFSDTETSTGNTFTAGDIDLQIDNESYVTNNAGVLVASPNNSWAMSNLSNQLFFSFSDVKPGDIGEDTISVHAGSNDAYACMAADITATPENTLVDPETDAGDAGPANGDNGELQNFLNFVFWSDDGDNVYEEGEAQITQLVGAANAIFNGAWAPIVGTSSTAIPGGSTRYVGKAWCFGALTPGSVAQDGLGKTGSNGPLVRGTGFTCDGSGNNNIAQTDGINVDVSFYAVQARNNGQFLCSSLPPFVGSTQPAIDWVETTATGGDASEIAGPTNSGSNLLQLTTINDTASRVRYTYDVPDIDASAFTGFSYDSKQVSATDAVNGNASFRLIVDLDGNLLTLGDVKDVTFEPYYNILAHNTLNDASITTGAWQNWAATMADGKFWASGVVTAAGASGGGGAYATNFTIAQLVAAYPSAKIIGISIGMGTFNVNQVVHVDNLVFNGTVLGFE